MHENDAGFSHSRIGIGMGIGIEASLDTDSDPDSNPEDLHGFANFSERSTQTKAESTEATRSRCALNVGLCSLSCFLSVTPERAPSTFRLFPSGGVAPSPQP